MYRIDLAALAHARGTFWRQAIDLGGAGTVTLPVGSRLNPPAWAATGWIFSPSICTELCELQPAQF
jgi:hypothetical protein